MSTSQESATPNMSFLSHLEALRWHLIRATLAIILCGFAAFIAKGFIFDTIIFGPKKVDFFTYRMLCKLSQLFGMEDGFCLEKLPFIIQSRTMAGQFSAHIWTAITAGFIIAFPYVIFEFWRFIKPAMHENEQKTAKGFIFASSILFFIGVLFGYYVIAPLSINFLGSYNVSAEVLNEFDLSSYIALIRSSVLASGFIFELPIIIFFLTKVGVVTPEILRKYRKFSLVGVLIVAAVITPPDVASQIIVTIPVLILYEISIFISKAVIKKEVKLQ